MKGVSEISGLRKIKSMRSSGKRSVPRVQSSAYLDLYMMRKERDRMEKEICILDKRKKDAQRNLDDINKEMDKLQKTGTERKESAAKEIEKPSQKDWKTMPLKY